MPVLPFRVVDAAEAAQLRSVTQGRENQIIPREIEAGTDIGKFAFSENVMFDKAFEDLHDMIRVAAPNATFIDTDVAWPAPPEEPEA